MTGESDLWRIWIDGHADSIELLAAGVSRGALARYRQIYVDYRAAVEQELFEDQ